MEKYPILFGIFLDCDMNIYMYTFIYSFFLL